MIAGGFFMIERFEVTTIHTTLDDRLEKYINKKLATLDRYVPRRNRASAHAEVIIKEEKALKGQSHKNPCTCEVTLHLPHEVINVSESTSNPFSAVDIVEAKLKHAITKYKERHAPGLLKRRLAGRSRESSEAPIV
jgi:ribosomal subunit interface protein